VAIITSFYDSGYDALFTFRQGVEAADGNAPETFVANQNDTNFISETIEKLKASKPDSIYLFMHGNDSDEMLRNLHLQNLNIPVITSAFSTEKHRLNNLGDAGNNIVSLSSWNKNDKTKENNKFVESYETVYHKEPDLFAVLGFETGQIIYESLSLSNGNYSGLKIADSIKKIAIKSPRGAVSVNPESGLVKSQLLVNKTISGISFIPENQVVKTLTPVSEFEESFAVLDNEFRSGWLNPYLFV